MKLPISRRYCVVKDFEILSVDPVYDGREDTKDMESPDVKSLRK